MRKSAKPIKSDLKRVDAHKVRKRELEEAPPLTRAQLAGAKVEIGGKPVRRGRPPEGAVPKKQVTVRLDAEVIEHFRKDGPGWQSRMNRSLRKAAGLK